MGARDTEAELLKRCLNVANGSSDSARDAREANAFRVASMIMRPEFPAQAERLDSIACLYFSEHAQSAVTAATVVRNGWISSLPRMRDMLSRELKHERSRSE